MTRFCIFQYDIKETIASRRTSKAIYDFYDNIHNVLNVLHPHKDMSKIRERFHLCHVIRKNPLFFSNYRSSSTRCFERDVSLSIHMSIYCIYNFFNIENTFFVCISLKFMYSHDFFIYTESKNTIWTKIANCAVLDIHVLSSNCNENHSHFYRSDCANTLQITRNHFNSSPYCLIWKLKFSINDITTDLFFI